MLTVADAKTMGWVVSTSENAYESSVTNAQEVHFVGKDGVSVSGKTVGEKRVVTIAIAKGDIGNNKDGSATPSTNGSNPTGYTTAQDVANAINESGWNVTVDHDDSEFEDKAGAAKSLVKAGETATFKSGKNLKVKQDGKNITFATKDDVNFTSVQFGADGPKLQAENGALKVSGSNGKEPVHITNLAGNLPGAKKGTIAPTDKSGSPMNRDIIAHNAATVGDVLNAGWYLQGNGVPKDFVKPYDTVNFVDGEGTTATIIPNPNGESSDITYSVNVDGKTTEITYTTKEGKTIYKLADGTYNTQRDGKGQLIKAEDITGSYVSAILPSTSVGGEEVSGRINFGESDTASVATNKASDIVVNVKTALIKATPKGNVEGPAQELVNKLAEAEKAVEDAQKAVAEAEKALSDNKDPAKVAELQKALAEAKTKAADPALAKAVTDVNEVLAKDPEANKVATAQNVADAINKSGFTLTAQGQNGSVVNPSETVDMKNTDGNIVIEKSADNNDVIYNLAKDIKVDSVQFGDANGPKIQQGDDGSIKVGDKNGGAVAITNVAAGKAPNDAVNVSQLEGLKNEISLNVTNVAVNVEKGLNFAGNKGDAINKKLGDTLTVKGDLANNATASAKNVRVDSEDGNLVVKIAENPEFNTVIIGGNNGTTTLSTVTLPKDETGNNVTTALDVGGNKITGVAAGDITPNSTQAVNGSQLYALAGGNKAVDTNITLPNGTTINTPVVKGDVIINVKDENGNVVEKKLEDQILMKTYNVENQTEYVTNSAAEAINKMNEGGIKFFHVNNGENSFQAQGNNSQDSSASAKYAAAIGYSAKAAGKAAVAFGYKAEATGTQSIAIGDGATVSGTQSISIGTGNKVTGNHSGAIGDPNTVSGSGSYAVGNNNSVSANESFVLGNNVAMNVENSVALGANTRATAGNGVGTKNLKADGTVGVTTTAGDKGKVASASVNGLVYGGFAGDTSHGVVSIGASGSERRIQNVAAGEISATSTDAINGSQLYHIAAKIGDINNQMNRNNKQLRAGIAGSNAAAGLPQVYIPGKSMVAASTGTYKGQSAVAVGYSRASDNGKLILKLQGNANTRGEFGGSVGVGYQW